MGDEKKPVQQKPPEPKPAPQKPKPPQIVVLREDQTRVTKRDK